MPKIVGNDLDFNSQSRILNLPTPTLAGHAANKGYVDSLVEGLAWKDNVRVSTASNINLASPGATLDGITMASGDRVLVRAQTTSSQNGIYVWNGAATPMTRASDASTSDELENAVVTVDEGTSAGATFRQQTLNFVLDTGNVSWSTFGSTAPVATETTSGTVEIATQAEVDAGTNDTFAVTPLKLANWAGRLRKGSLTFGDGAATQYDFTHNFNTQDVVVLVRRTSGAFDEVLCDVEVVNANAVRVRFAVAPTSNQFRITVIG